MKEVIDFINPDITILGIPGIKLVIATLILIITLLFRKMFSVWVLKYIRKLTARTETKLDDALIDILNPPMSFFILLIGVVITRLILVPYINPAIDRILQSILDFGLVVVICWIVYRSADVFTGYLEKIAGRTRTELDDLLVPYLKKVIKIAAVVIVVIKGAEIFLGMSAAALLGLTGGIGLTLGLVFKDIIANWFGCGIIYIDNLFREGDWVQLDEGKVIDADVEEIGIRSTKFRNFDKTVSVVPNAVIANSIIKNWSRMYKRRVKYNFTVDGISAGKLELILAGIREILTLDEDIHQEFHMVNFRELEGNSRIIRLYYFTKTTVWADHEQIRENVNLKILKLFENEGIDKLAYTIVDLSDDRPYDFKKSSVTE